MTEAFVEKLNLKTRLGYGIGDIAICLYWSGVGLYLLYFYTRCSWDLSILAPG
jgi:Na+/melibiose symporter and related transporters